MRITFQNCHPTFMSVPLNILYHTWFQKSTLLELVFGRLRHVTFVIIVYIVEWVELHLHRYEWHLTAHQCCGECGLAVVPLLFLCWHNSFAPWCGLSDSLYWEQYCSDLIIDDSMYGSFCKHSIAIRVLSTLSGTDTISSSGSLPSNSWVSL